MALKDILVYLDQSDRALANLRLAAELARRHGAQITALYVKELSRTQMASQGAAELGLAPAAALDTMNRRIETALEDAASRLRTAVEATAQQSGVKIEWRCVTGVASRIVPQQARYADLTVIGTGDPIDNGAAEYNFAEQLLFVTGRPVLLVPHGGTFATVGRHIAIAWNGSRPAARSLNDALPLVELAERTTVIMVNPAAIAERHGTDPGRGIVEHLERHGAHADAISLNDVAEGAITDTIRNKAQSIGADMIVAGAFGHPKLWEKFLGGVTRGLLERMTLPVLMSY